MVGACGNGIGVALDIMARDSADVFCGPPSVHEENLVCGSSAPDIVNDKIARQEQTGEADASIPRKHIESRIPLNSTYVFSTRGFRTRNAQA